MKPILGWTDIPVVSLDRAVTFYAGMLAGPVVVVGADSGALFGLLPHHEDGPSGCLVVADDNQPGAHGPLIYLSVEGRLDEALAFVAANGGRVVSPKHSIAPHGFRALILDTEGNRIALHSDAP